jgi:hypothetical protein
MAVYFEPHPRKIFCALNVSNDCKGMLAVEDCYMDENEQLWNVCDPCAEHEKITVEQLMKIRREDGG